MANTETINNHAVCIWSVADLLRGDNKQSEYGRGILPFTLLRRLDCVLGPVKADIRDPVRAGQRPCREPRGTAEYPNCEEPTTSTTDPGARAEIES